MRQVKSITKLIMISIPYIFSYLHRSSFVFLSCILKKDFHSLVLNASVTQYLFNELNPLTRLVNNVVSTGSPVDRLRNNNHMYCRYIKWKPLNEMENTQTHTAPGSLKRQLTILKENLRIRVIYKFRWKDNNYN